MVICPFASMEVELPTGILVGLVCSALLYLTTSLRDSGAHTAIGANLDQIRGRMRV